MKEQLRTQLTHFRNSNFKPNMKRLQIPRKLVYAKFYVHEIAAKNVSKIYFLKNAKKTCKRNNHNLNRDWIIWNKDLSLWKPWNIVISLVWKTKKVIFSLACLRYFERFFSPLAEIYLGHWQTFLQKMFY